MTCRAPRDARAACGEAFEGTSPPATATRGEPVPGQAPSSELKHILFLRVVHGNSKDDLFFSDL